MLLVPDETDCKRRVAGHTLNYHHRKPFIPPPAALPQFPLPSDASDGPEGLFDVQDPLDSAATAQRPALTSAGARRLVRRRKIIAADSTEEVQVEDILLEAYAEDPPPPPSRSRAPAAPPLPPSASIASAIAAVVPPPPAQSAAVDALLRASDPMFAPYPPQGQGYAPGYAHAQVYPQATGYAADETPSVSPMMLASAAPVVQAARPVVGTGSRTRRMHRGVVLALWSVVIMVVGVAAGAAIVMGVRNGTYARVRDTAKSAAARASTKSTAPAEAAAAAAPPPAAAPAPPPVVAPVIAPAPVVAPAVAPARAPAPAAMPTVSVDSLPKQTIPADSTLVTFPDYAKGHRVFFDGRVIAVADGSPTKLKCGRHMIKIGSARKPRVTDLACGHEVTLP